MKRTIFKTLAALLMLSVAGGLYYLHLLTPVITGYAAKNLASGVFVGNRTQESMENTDLNFSFIRFTSNTVDTVKKEVTSRFLWATSKAIYIDGQYIYIIPSLELVIVRTGFSKKGQFDFNAFVASIINTIKY